jgi:hypothetical protein
MARNSRSATIAVLLLCLLGTPGTGVAFAADEGPAADTTASPAGDLKTSPGDNSASAVLSVAPAIAVAPVVAGEAASLSASRFSFGADWLTTQWSTGASVPGLVTLKTSSEPGFAAQRYRGGSRGRRNAAMGAVILGAAAAITGAALLVYANRPDCSADRNLNGCGYGTKVVGGAVLSAGVVGMVAGAIAW